MSPRWILPVLTLAVLATACKKEEPKASAPPSPQAAVPAAASAPDAPAPAVNLATEPHRVRTSNYAKSPVTVTLNGEWIGQWDNDVSNPVAAVKGKNTLLIEVGGDPKSSLTVSIDAQREGRWVPLLSFDFQGKPGKHEAVFVAK